MNDTDRARSALHALDSGCPRDEWARIGMAFKDAGGSLDDFIAWSEGAANFESERDCRDAWRSFKPGKVTAATLFARARDAGWREPTNGHSYTARASAPRTRQNGAQRPKLDAATVWASCEPASATHGYIARKLGLPFGLRTVPESATLAIAGQRVAGWLAVPMFEGDATEPASLQFIPPAEGKKLNLPGHPVAGWFTVGGPLAELVFVAEGLGQCWSAHQATGKAAVCCFGAGRMETVARALRERSPAARLVIIADAGKEADAERIASAVRGAWVPMPEGSPANFDLNDYHQRVKSLSAVADLLAQAREPEPAESADDDEPREIDLAELAEREPEPPAFIVPDWLPAGEVTLLAANGGTGKSLHGLQLTVCLALTRDFHGLPVAPRGVDFVSFEDRREVLHWRLYRTCKALGVDMRELLGKVRLYDGTRCLSAWFSRDERGASGPTPAYHRMAGRIGGPGRVVVVDGSSDTFAGNENDRAQVKAFVRMLRRLIAEDGALLLLAHVDKPAAKAGAESLGFSGSTGWHNGVRCRWYMFAETDDEGTETGNIVVEVRKSNLGPSGARMVLRFDAEAHAFRRVDSEAPQRDRAFQRADEADAIIAAIRAAWAAGDPIPAATAGTRTAHSVCEARDDFPKSLRGRSGRRRFNKALEQLRAAGAVQVVPFRRTNRHMGEALYARE